MGDIVICFRNELNKSTDHTCSSMYEETDDQPLELVVRCFGIRPRIVGCLLNLWCHSMESKHQRMSKAVSMFPNMGNLSF